MNGRRITLTVLGAVAIAATVWWFMLRRGPSDGELALQWRGRHRGNATFPMTFTWCPVTRTGVLEAVSGDSGVSIVLYEPDSIRAGTRAIVAPELAPSVARPAATAAMRWVRDTIVEGFKASSGQLTLRHAAGTISGTVMLRLHGVVNADSLTLTGAFSNVRVVAMAAGCV